MKVLITGAAGQLGQELMSCANTMQGVSVIGLDRKQLDVTHEQQVLDIITKYRPDAIIHAAAYTAVDRAESERELAYDVNALGSKFVAKAAQTIGAKCCMISTDYVFDGKGSVPYNEGDQTEPVNWYGYTKRAGEQFVQQLSSCFFIVRTSWVYGPFGNNFMKTMLKLGGVRPIQVVNDQMGSPTYTADLASFLLKLVATDKYGIYHATNTGSCTWYEFAREIFATSGIEADLSPCTSAEYETAAKRPAYSVLGSEMMEKHGFGQFRHWKEGLKACLTRMQKK